MAVNSGIIMKKDLVIAIVLASTIVATVLFTVCYGEFSIPSASLLNLSRDFTFKTQDSTAAVIDSNVFVISSLSTYLSIESTDWDYNNCTITLDEKDRIFGKIRSEAVGDSIFVWNEIDYQNSDTNLTFLLLDPWNCDYTALANLEYSVPFEIVVNQGYIEIFSANRSKNCSPCRFDENGVLIELQNQVEEENVPVDSTTIKTFNEGNNYAYVVNRGGMAIIKILDQDFNVLKQMNTSSEIYDLAVSPDPNSTTTSIGILYQSPSEHRSHIEVFDLSSPLQQPVFTARLPHPHAYKIANDKDALRLAMDSRGNSFVNLVLLSDVAEKHKFLRYNATGHLDREFELNKFKRDGVTVSQSFLIDDREYCLVNHREVKQTGRTYVKCIDTSEI